VQTIFSVILGNQVKQAALARGFLQLRSRIVDIARTNAPSLSYFVVHRIYSHALVYHQARLAPHQLFPHDGVRGCLPFAALLGRWIEQLGNQVELDPVQRVRLVAVAASLGEIAGLLLFGHDEINRRFSMSTGMDLLPLWWMVADSYRECILKSWTKR